VNSIYRYFLLTARHSIQGTCSARLAYRG